MNEIYNKKDFEIYIIKNNIEAIKYLFDNKLIDINIQNDEGWNPLMYDIIL
jgi:ankyrin repeat protein